jgi:hypothetical protein
MAQCEPLQAQSAAGREPLDRGLVLVFGVTSGLARTCQRVVGRPLGERPCGMVGV